MKAEDLKTKTMDELSKLLMDTRKAQMNMRFQRAGGQLENTAEIRKVRRTIARIKTYMTVQRKGEAAPAGAAKKAPAKKAAGAKKTAKKAEKAA